MMQAKDINLFPTVEVNLTASGRGQVWYFPIWLRYCVRIMEILMAGTKLVPTSVLFRLAPGTRIVSTIEQNCSLISSLGLEYEGPCQSSIVALEASGPNWLFYVVVAGILLVFVFWICLVMRCFRVRKKRKIGENARVKSEERKEEEIEMPVLSRNGGRPRSCPPIPTVMDHLGEVETMKPSSSSASKEESVGIAGGASDPFLWDKSYLMLTHDTPYLAFEKIDQFDQVVNDPAETPFTFPHPIPTRLETSMKKAGMLAQSVCRETVEPQVVDPLQMGTSTTKQAPLWKKMGRGDREGADRRRSRRSRSRSPVERERPERDRYEYDRHRERDGDRYERDRDRGDWRERDRDRTLRDRERERRPRSRSSSPSRRYRYRSPSPSTKPVDPKAMTGRTQDIPDDIDESEMTEEEKAMKEILGWMQRFSPGSKTFLAQTFNLLTLCSPNFVNDVAALEFLIHHGFDFNRQISKGIRYTPPSSSEETNASEVSSPSLSSLFDLLVANRKARLIFHNGFIDLVFLYHVAVTMFADLNGKYRKLRFIDILRPDKAF
ncbi:unnamed protein product [Cyprideis torosa]|uniref:Uncharacterized protein n=1 Tax=Cyprideis torosa TaxID=163714 RepID=A0A7R8W8M3_9CRUS|nr:unnamed protein product [Cyprideis torosa]CAG0888756.1 unnamed protein product [Cyprideis torosa]